METLEVYVPCDVCQIEAGPADLWDCEDFETGEQYQALHFWCDFCTLQVQANSEKFREGE